MRSPDSPATVPDPGIDGAYPYIEAGVGPETAQSQTARAALATGIMSGAIGQGAGMTVTNDVRSPQIFVSHPVFTDAVASTAVGDETAGESLPGRIRSGEWDGEPTWVAAFGGA